MKLKGIIILCFIYSYGMHAQKSNEFKTIDEKSLQMPDSLTQSTIGMAKYIRNNFRTESEKVRAIYIWVATNIRYDVENMYAINFYEKEDDKVNKALNFRKGNCANYSALFNEVCLKCGLQSYVVEGYTMQHGDLSVLPHGWNAVFVDKEWCLFDPTWGSGFVSKRKFHPEINNRFFKVKPSEFIKTHMPFDYLWQFLNYPLSSKEFMDGQFNNTSKPFFSYVDSIKAFEALPENEQWVATARRIEAGGVKNDLIFDRLRHIKEQIEVYRQNKMVNLFNAASEDFNEGASAFNAFIDYRNKQFTPQKTDFEIQEMLNAASRKFKSATTKLDQIQNPNDNIKTLMVSSRKLIDDTIKQVNEQQDFLNRYFPKNKEDRHDMFYTKIRKW